MSVKKASVDKTISEICFNFFKAIPGVASAVGKPFGGVYYVEKRMPPYEDLAQSKSLGYDFIRRDANSVLLVYLIDYENEDSVTILKELISEKETKNVKWICNNCCAN